VKKPNPDDMTLARISARELINISDEASLLRAPSQIRTIDGARRESCTALVQYKVRIRSLIVK
jgi:hypothetical protein